MLGIGGSALLAFQRALATAGHNIANAASTGYSRQRVELAALPARYSGAGYLGSGVRTGAVVRLHDDFLSAQVRSSTASLSRLELFHDLASEVDNLLAGADTGLTPALQDFFDALHTVANDPASPAARQVLLGDAGSLVQRFHVLYGRLAEMRASVNGRIGLIGAEIGGLADAIAGLNRDIALALARGTAPADLLDRRDRLIDDLSAKVALTTVTQDDGSVNVFIGNGQTLVLGGNSFAVTAIPGAHDPADRGIGYMAGNTVTDITGEIAGGELGALVEFRATVLDTAENALGRIAHVLAYAVNAGHRNGMTLDGALGGDFFTVAAPAVLPHVGNGGGTVSVTIADATALTLSDYRLRHDGAGIWTLTRLSDGAVQTGAGPFTVDGLVVVAGGAPAVGDSFLIRPVRDGARSIAMRIADPRAVAAAAPIRAGAASANIGNATISAGEVRDVTDPALLVPVTLEFVDEFSYRINGAGPSIPYASGADVDLNGWRVRITGRPEAGDVFYVQDNVGGAGDNRNVLALAALQSAGLMDGAGTSLQQACGRVLADVGTQARTAAINRDAYKALREQALAARESVSGVNLDEEAADLLRFQQAYQAAAQVIAAADDLFETLLAAVRR
jgi:flagellar hook-associated protein 1 FlgK